MIAGSGKSGISHYYFQRELYMKKMFIVSSLLALFLANSPVFAQDAAGQDDQSLSGTNFSSNSGQNPFAAPTLDNASGQPQPDTAGQTADDSDSW